MECTGWGIGGGQGAVSGVHRVGYRRGAGCGEWSAQGGATYSNAFTTNLIQ